ncbi:DUF4145 domain-containing protein [Bacillus haimaensis]|uniref:DUF4145 domain-containing protein n=1 Tax=Bacillus haimaensis TaxID=3160967 RepID=UPI003AA7C03C
MSNSTLFDFVGKFSAVLGELAGRVEALLMEQPQATLTQARLYSEILVKMICEEEGVEEVYPLKPFEKINRLYKQDLITDEVYTKLEWLRKKGNVATHQVKEVELGEAVQAHKFLFDLSVWYAEIYVSHEFEAPVYQLPVKQVQEEKVLKEDELKKLMEPYLQDTLNKLLDIQEQLDLLKQEKAADAVAESEVAATSDLQVHTKKTVNRTVPLSEEILAVFQQNNYEKTNTTKKAVEFVHEENNQVIYLLDNSVPTIVLHPELVQANSDSFNIPEKPRASTALRRFPRGQKDGKQTSNFGYPFKVEQANELNEILQKVNNLV